jgi:protein disulfide-isomerase
MNSVKRILLPAFLLVVTAGWTQTAQAARVAWRKDLKQAAAEAEKTGKPILVQFTADWCGYCHKMLRETFTDDSVIKQVNECFVPVVLDADEHDRLVETVGVSAFPTTVIISPTLDVDAKIEGFHRPTGFKKRIAAYCQKQKAARAAVAAETPVNKSGQSLNQPIRPATANLETAPTTRNTSTEDKPVAEAPTAFDGLCLVSLLNDRKFKPGSKTIDHEFNGVKLLFASETNRQKFIADPQKFWPVADGNCPVATVNVEQDTTGDVRTVAVFRGRLVLFHSLEHRGEFAGRPGDYLQRVEQIQQARR